MPGRLSIERRARRPTVTAGTPALLARDDVVAQHLGAKYGPEFRVSVAGRTDLGVQFGNQCSLLGLGHGFPILQTARECMPDACYFPATLPVLPRLSPPAAAVPA